MPIVTLADCPIPAADWEMKYHPQATLSGDENGWTAKLSFYIKSFDSVVPFVVWAGGQAYTVDLGGGTYATRYIPLSHPDFPSLLCRGIEVEWTGEPSSVSTDKMTRTLYSCARVHLTFKSVPYAVDGSTPFMTINTRTGLESYAIGGTRYEFASGEPIDAAAELYVPTGTYSVKIFQCIGLGDDVASPLQGTLNTASLFDNAAGTMMFMGMTSDLTANTSGTPIYTRELVWNFRGVHWNYNLQRDGTWGLVLKPDGNPKYTLANHAVLLQ